MRLPLIREVTAGALALTIVALFLILILLAIQHLTAPELTPLKELIGMVNGTFGLVVGYYFSRATSDARAERAERELASAHDEVARMARIGGRLEQQLDTTGQQLEQARLAVRTLLQSAEPLVSAVRDPLAPGDTSNFAAGQARLELAIYLAREMIAADASRRT